MAPIERMAEPSDAGDDDADLRAFEAMREIAVAEGISQVTPAAMPGLMALFRRAGLLRDESDDTSVEPPPSAGDSCSDGSEPACNSPHDS
ncbi:hypothetical protein [Caldimonas sp. KR1-144]|uniref:hypothetical protein n=1 Tax=Caldimonas sp. KR1-144 TaxID=3400911 RepID=UPI003BFFE721